MHYTKKNFSRFRVFLSWAHDFNCCRINIKEISKFIMQKFRLFQFLSAGCWEQWNVPHDWNWGDTWMWGQTEAGLSPGPSVLSSTAYRYMQRYGALVGIFHQPGFSLEASLLVLCSVGKKQQLNTISTGHISDGCWWAMDWDWLLILKPLPAALHHLKLPSSAQVIQGRDKKQKDSSEEWQTVNTAHFKPCWQ